MQWASYLLMKRRGLGSLLAVALLLAAVPISARVLGVFQGRIVQEPYVKAKQKWMSVQSHNGFVRRVNITKAAVEYEVGFPAEARQQRPESALRSEIEVRITAYKAASSTGDGDWRATEILILAPKAEARVVRTGTNGYSSEWRGN
jgi:hypothetical protein